MQLIDTCPFNLKDDKIRILWEITPRCNMRCKHCLFYDNEEILKEELTTKQIYKIIDNISKEPKVREIWISGGEPLIRDDIVQICSYISKKNIVPSISTNGILLTRQLAEDLYKSGVRYIHLSIDGATEETHDNLRRTKNAFKKLMEAMDILKQSPIKFGASFMVTEESIKEIEDVLEIAKQKQLNVISFYLVARLGRGAKNFNDNQEDLSKKLLEKMEKIDKAKYENLKIEVFRTPNYKQPSNGLKECKGYNFLNITYDGRLGACPWLMKSENKFDVGSLLDEDFVILKEQCVNKMKEKIEKRKNSIEFCRKCSYNSSCKKGCVALQINDKDELNGLDPICPKLHQEVTYA